MNDRRPLHTPSHTLARYLFVWAATPFMWLLMLCPSTGQSPSGADGAARVCKGGTRKGNNVPLDAWPDSTAGRLVLQSQDVSRGTTGGGRAAVVCMRRLVDVVAVVK